MRALAAAGAVLMALAVVACEEKKVEAPAPRDMTADAIGHYCGMSLQEHAGPKAQIILSNRPQVIWFSSARDAFSFTMLPDEPKDVAAIYVSDMAKAESWDRPGPSNWVEARSAYFVIDSRKKGGMGADETVPFSDLPAAERFAAANGGKVVRFENVPREYVLGSGTPQSGSDHPRPTR